MLKINRENKEPLIVNGDFKGEFVTKISDEFELKFLSEELEIRFNNKVIKLIEKYKHWMKK